MFEVEIKIKLRNKSEFETRLNTFGAGKKCILIHEDMYYNMPEGFRNFAETDEALRIRKTTEFYSEDDLKKGRPASISADVSYKGPKLDKITKTRLEYKTRIEDALKLDKIFIALGFRRILKIKKIRKIYGLKYKGSDVEITVDQIDGLEGYYAELEILAPESEKPDYYREKLFELLGLLGYEKNDSITKSYLELVLEKNDEINK